ncbi:Serine/threonine-protein kinase PknK [Pandoraea terrae]|uniref:Serine/threonine-protein kinase PknK n=1 Tax=Pandoraea terrae TaxID=1537710 RepID=A0A5E4Z0X5_9BURK|nr:LuxR C-terminal-related transcriptional regulator [Pandoraea terrae]VVE54871.1 Serine/threonine-protein kinase PknK [Pandoraea terrae]
MSEASSFSQVSRRSLLKLRPPCASPAHIKREDLVLRIQNSDAPLVIVSAPAGYGKSTAIAQLHSQACAAAIPVAWLTLEPADNDLGRFSGYLALSLACAFPQQRHLNYESPDMSSSSAAGNSGAYQVLDALAGIESPFLLFLDDFEHITSPETIAFVIDFVSCLAYGQRVILGSRHKTGLPLGRLRVQGRLLEIEVTDLKFNSDEIRRYVNGRIKTALNDSDIQRLQQTTDGWAAALQLTTTALMNQPNPTRLLQNLSGRSKEIADYLAEDVLARLPSDHREFLLKSAVFESFCPAMCDEVFGRNDSTQMIEKTVKDNLFLQMIDADGYWYRYHPLFRDFLRSQRAAAEQFDAQLAAIHLRAARWLEGTHRGIQAVDHAIAGGDMDMAASFMANYANEFVRTGQFGVVSQWMGILPESAIQARPMLAIAGAYAMTFLHRYQDAEKLVAIIDPALTEMSEYRNELLGLRVMLGAWCDRLPEVMEVANQSVDGLENASPYVVGLIRNSVAYREIALGNYVAALGHLGIAKRALEPINAVHGLSYSQCFEGAIELLQGNVHQAHTRFAGILASIVNAGYRFTNSTAVAAAHLVEAQYELNDLDAAELLLSEYLTLIRDSCLPDHLITSYRIAARIEAIRGRTINALDILNQLQDVGDVRGIPRITAAARQDKLRLALRASDIPAGTRLLNLISSDDLWRSWRNLFPYAEDIDDPFISSVRLALVAGTAPSMIDKIHGEIRTAELHNRYRRVIRLKCLLAQAFEAARKRQQASDTLAGVLVQAQQRGLFRVIVDDAWLLKPLLESLESRPSAVSPQYLVLLIKALPSTQTIQPPSSQPHGKKAPDSNLSPRELQILRLLADGLSNKELSKKLFVTENTVETHLRRIYAKLGTKNRTQAVTFAREKQVI